MLKGFAVLLMALNLCYTFNIRNVLEGKPWLWFTISRFVVLLSVIGIEICIMIAEGMSVWAWLLIICCLVLLWQTILDLRQYYLNNKSEKEEKQLEMFNLPWRTKEK